MDERREHGPGSGSSPPVAGQGRLSPVQQAHNEYSHHATTCPKCRDIDRGRCNEGEQLWRDWNTACDDAYRRLNAEIP